MRIRQQCIHRIPFAPALRGWPVPPRTRKGSAVSSVVLEHVRKVYDGGVAAVKDFNLVVEDREFVVFVGPSGCGKTTVLRMVAGLEAITDGEVRIDGQAVNDVAPKDRDIAMVFQNYALYPHMTVRENMAFALKLRKVPKPEIEATIQKAARILELGDLLDRKPRALSGGQRQRVALGRAIVRNPKVFLMDEPLSNLDAKLRVQMRTEIMKLQQKLAATIIYVTHDQTEAMTMGDRIVVMREGVIQQIGTPQEVYDHPVNLFVAQFIGSPQMNILDARAVREGRGLSLRLADGTTLPLSEEHSALLESRGYLDKEVSLGIRPEALEEAGGNAADEHHACLSGAVEVAELLGSEIYLHSRVCGAQVTARIPPGGARKPGAPVFLHVRREKLHLFDPATTLAIR